MAQNNLARWEKEADKRDKARARREREELKHRVNALENDSLDDIGINGNDNKDTTYMARIYVAGKDVADINGRLISDYAEAGEEFRDGDFLLDQPDAVPDNAKLYKFHHNQWNEILSKGDDNGTIIVETENDLLAYNAVDYLGRFALTTVNPAGVGWMNVGGLDKYNNIWLPFTHIRPAPTLAP